MSNTPLPEPLPLPTLTKAAGGCYMGKYDLHQLTSVEFQRALDAHAAAVSAAKDARIKVLENALTKIDAIRNDIIGRQKIGWSSHVYPLVAALGEAGYPGMDYEAARAALGDKNG